MYKRKRFIQPKVTGIEVMKVVRFPDWVRFAEHLDLCLVVRSLLGNPPARQRGMERFQASVTQESQNRSDVGAAHSRKENDRRQNWTARGGCIAVSDRR